MLILFPLQMMLIGRAVEIIAKDIKVPYAKTKKEYKL
jgi:hypothetical protein